MAGLHWSSLLIPSPLWDDCAHDSFFELQVGFQGIINAVSEILFVKNYIQHGSYTMRAEGNSILALMD